MLSLRTLFIRISRLPFAIYLSGVFRLAETVSIASFADEKATKQLEERISQRKNLHAPTSAPPLKSPSPLLSQAGQLGSPDTKPPAEPSALRFKVLKPFSKNQSRQSLISALKSKDSSSSLRSWASKAKHGVNASKSSVSSLRRNSDALSKPRKNTTSSRLRFIDAVMDRPGKARGDSKQKADNNASPAKEHFTSREKESEGDMEALDRRFANLLGSYLEENDLQPPSDLYESSTTKEEAVSLQSDSEDSEDEYVYDIYFREKETMWGFGPTGASDVGLKPAEVAGREEEAMTSSSALLRAGEDKTAEAQYVMEPMATLIGFGDEDDMINEMENASKLMSQEVPNDSDDEFDEGEDEDSNDEGFYRNDYPEDEGEEDDEYNQAGWGWSGPRRRGQQRTSSDEDGDEDEDGNDSGSELHDD
jgi:hypothetical protein